jgi:hypothetical protein
VAVEFTVVVGDVFLLAMPAALSQFERESGLSCVQMISGNRTCIFGQSGSNGSVPV